MHKRCSGKDTRSIYPAAAVLLTFILSIYFKMLGKSEKVAPNLWVTNKLGASAASSDTEQKICLD